MDKVRQIFLRDIKRILRNPVAIVVTIGVCIIPSLYAWLNILANWDPYKNTSDIPIAVVNEDQGAQVGDMGYLDAGDMVVDKLKENDQLKWTFVNRDEALEGVRAGRYYAAIVMPSDFTSTLSGVLDGRVEQVHVAYYANEKENAVAPKVTDTGATTVENQINDTFVGTVSKVVTEKTQGAAGEALDDVNATIRGLSRDIEDIADKLDGLSDDVSETRGTIGSLRDSVASARTTLDSLSGSTDTFRQSLDSALGALGDTRSNSLSLATQLSGALGVGSSKVAGISARANYDVGALAGDAGWALARVDDAISELEAENGQTQTIQGTLGLALETTAKIDDQTVRTQLQTELSQEIAVVTQLSQQQQDQLEKLRTLDQELRSNIGDVSNLASTLNTALQNGSSALSDTQGSLATVTIPALSSALDKFSDVGSRTSGTLAALPAVLAQTDATLAQLDATLASCDTSLSELSGTLQSSAGGLRSLADDVRTLQSAENLKPLQDLLNANPEDVGSFMNSPAEIMDTPVFPVANYGSGVAPFYTNLALWVGGFVLVAIYKLEVDKEQTGDFKPWQGYLGRWLLLAVLGTVQATVCCIGDIALGIQCLSPVAFVFAGIIESLVYVGFIYALSVAFKHIGKALGVLLVVLQIPGSSGTYPIEMMPGFFRALSPWLPFTYGINAMREAIAGFYGSYFACDIFMLLLLIPISLLIGVTARRHLLNINALFDRKLAETDLMVTERTGLPEAHFRLSTLIKALLDSQRYKEVFLGRAANFELRYPTYIRRGFASLVVVPLVLLTLLFVLPFKMLMLTLWIVSLVAISVFLIVVEYFHSRIGEKCAMADLSQDELFDLMNDELKQEFLAFAPLERMRRSLADRHGLLTRLHNNGRRGE